MSKTSAKELLIYIEKKIKNGDYKDSVHKITLMTTRNVIQKILEEELWIQLSYLHENDSLTLSNRCELWN